MTPRRTTPMQAPAEVQQAVAYAKAEAERIIRSGNTPRNGFNPDAIADMRAQKNLYADLKIGTGVGADGGAGAVEVNGMNPYLLTPMAYANHNNTFSGPKPEPLFKASTIDSSTRLREGTGSIDEGSIDARYVRQQQRADSIGSVGGTHQKQQLGPPPPTNNGYSVGASLPQGVSWRYVDVLSNPELLKK